MEELNEQIAETLRGLGFDVATPSEVNRNHDQADLAVRLPTSEGETLAAVDLEHRAKMTPVELEKWRGRHPDGTILGCDYVSPSFAQRLQAAGIDYVDSAGNAHISRPGLRVHIEGRRANRAVRPPAVGHHQPVLGPASLRVVFTLLVDPDMAGATFDDLTNVAGVAKGTVHNTVSDLTLRGHLSGSRRKRRLLDVPRLAELWVDGFATQLLPRLAQQVVAGPTPEWWTEHTDHGMDITVGGGPALAHYGGSLRPDTTTLYGRPPWTAARKLGHLTSRGAHNVILRERFWSPELLPNARFVHPLLAYAEAMAGGDSREVEAARDLRNGGLIPL